MPTDRARSQRRSRGYSFLEVLIVATMLGVLALIVVPQYSRAVENSAESSTFDQLVQIRRAVQQYAATHQGRYPSIAAGPGTWGELLGPDLKDPPENRWVPLEAGRVITLARHADERYQVNYGWIFDPETGRVWAGGFDKFDNPLPRE